jgi:Cu+-exporting ATPase
LLLRPGARVAVDGIVETGESHVDEAMLTGEPLPVTKAPGDPVTAGTVNGSGSLTYRATAVGADTVLARIVAMVEDAQAARLPVQSLIDRVTAVFVPVVLIDGGSGGCSLAPPRVRSVQGPGGDGLGPDHRLPLRHGPRDAGLDPRRHGARGGAGVLFRQGSALQALGGVDLIAFDKTGTLTEGRPHGAGLHPPAGTPGRPCWPCRIGGGRVRTSACPRHRSGGARTRAELSTGCRISKTRRARRRREPRRVSVLVGSAKHLRLSGHRSP